MAVREIQIHLAQVIRKCRKDPPPPHSGKQYFSTAISSKSQTMAISTAPKSDGYSKSGALATSIHQIIVYNLQMLSAGPLNLSSTSRSCPSHGLTVVVGTELQQVEYIQLLLYARDYY